MDDVDQPPRAVPGSAPARRLTLMDFFPLYREANPRLGETVKGAFFGQSVGRLRRRMQRLVVFIVVCVPAVMIPRDQPHHRRWSSPRPPASGSAGSRCD
jgi:hypothetical protein